MGSRLDAGGKWRGGDGDEEVYFWRENKKNN